MKRKNLFLSLIGSILVAVAIVTVTVVSVIKPKTNNKDGVPGADNININNGVSDDVDIATKYDLENKFNRNGSEEYPYIIYSADNFKTLISTLGGEKRIVTVPVTEEVTGEDGETKTVNLLDEYGHLVFVKVLDENGEETYDVNHFELVNDIDFSGVAFTTLFNNGKAFIGSIDGNGFAIKNISINVNEKNFETEFSFVKDGNRYSRIALFGETKGAVLKDMTIDNLKVSVPSIVYSYISAAKYEIENPYAEMVVAGISAYATDTTLSNVTLNAEVDGSSYFIDDVDKDGNYLAENAMGGVTAVAKNLTIENSTMNIKLSANAGGEYLVGGIAAYGTIAKVSKSSIDVEMITSYSRRLTMAGMFAYGNTLNIQDTIVRFTLKEIANAETRNAYVASLTKDGTAKASDMSTAAGLVAVLRANNDTQKTTISNVKVTSNIDFDCIYAGAILDVYSTDAFNKSLVTLSDIVVDANANVLALHGIARQLVATTVTYSEDARIEGYYNVKLAGDVKLSKYEVKINSTTTDERDVMTILVATKEVDDNTGVNYVAFSWSDLYVEISSNLNSKLVLGDAIAALVKSFGSFKVV